MKSRDSLERDGTLGKSYIPDETLHYPRQRDGTTAHLVARDILHVLGQAVLAIFPTSRLDSLPYTRSTLYASHDPINQSFLHFLFFFPFLSIRASSFYIYVHTHFPIHHYSRFASNIFSIETPRAKIQKYLTKQKQLHVNKQLRGWTRVIYWSLKRKPFRLPYPF